MYRIGIDVGGTFTDLYALDDAEQAIAAAKVPSTPPDDKQGVLTALVFAAIDLARMEH
jgi:N-methylhydantoinase A/oxoprolinase/acetone carboxylase beta subunit